jgi:hypothetical protein
MNDMKRILNFIIWLVYLPLFLGIITVALGAAVVAVVTGRGTWENGTWTRNK